MTIQKYRFLLAFWTIIIIVSLSIPGSTIPKTTIFGLDKWVHGFLFLIWTLMLLNSFQNISRKHIIFICIVGLMFAVSSELYQQTFIINRQADIFDAIADVIGLLMGIVLYRLRRV